MNKNTSNEKLSLNECLERETLYSQVAKLKEEVLEANRIIGGILKSQHVHGPLEIDLGSELGEAMVAFCERHPNV